MSARVREVCLGPFDLQLERRPDGTIRARSPHRSATIRRA